MVAQVRGFHGVRGGMRVEVLTDRLADRLAPGRRLFREGSPEALTIVEARPADPGWIIRLEEVTTRAAADAFREVYLEAEVGPRERLPRGAYYWHELIGCPVTDPAGGDLGVVRDVYRSGGSEVLVVAGGPRGEFDLPVARPFIRRLAPRRGVIVADPETLDLPEPGRARPPRPARPARSRKGALAAGAAGAPDDTLPANAVPDPPPVPGPGTADEPGA